MAFKFAARTLLELGKELISSDEVALYELIKNAVDAGSSRIEVSANVVLAHADYVGALEDLAEGVRTADVLAQLRARMDSTASSQVQGAFVATLRQAVGNRGRFRAALLMAYRRHNRIEVRDHGHGMTRDELDQVFLTVGTRSRRSENIAGGRFLGDKGVGRLSAMRLGDYLTVITSRAGERRESRLRIDWRIFSHDNEADVSTIVVEPEDYRAKSDPRTCGTVIRVSSLNSDWTLTSFTELFHGRIARMIDPFEAGRANALLDVSYNGNAVLVPSVPKALLQSAHASCRASFRFEEGEDGERVPVLDGEIAYPLRNASRAVRQRGVEVYSLAQRATKRRGKAGHAASEVTPIRRQALEQLGPFTVEVYWYNRRIVEAVEELTENQRQTRERIAQWAGGPMLYRHGFRILPYGDPDDDWLELDRNAFGQSGFKLNRGQVIGRVLVSSGHAALSEQTNREGLVESEPARALLALLKWLLHVDMRGLINECDAIEQLERKEAEKLVLGFRDTQRQVREALADLRTTVGPQHRTRVDRVESSVDELADQCAVLVRKTDAVIAESIGDREKFVHLAGIGLMTEFIFHELDRSVGHTLNLLGQAPAGGMDPALEALEEQLKTLRKRISAFDELTGEKRQTRSRFDLAEVVGTVVRNHANQFQRHGIEVDISGTLSGYPVRAVKGMVIQILENLVANSVYWLKQQARQEPDFRPAIQIELDRASKTLAVTDNGPGVDPDRRMVIFQPFVSSKPAGQGRGLGLYISRELARHHRWDLYLDTLPSTRPKRLSSFVLDLEPSDEH